MTIDISIRVGDVRLRYRGPAEVIGAGGVEGSSSLSRGLRAGRVTTIARSPPNRDRRDRRRAGSPGALSTRGPALP